MAPGRQLIEGEPDDCLRALARELALEGRFRDEAQRHWFRQVVATLRRIYTEHIRHEDEELFPLAARALDACEIASVGEEMAARRGLRWRAR